MNFPLAFARTLLWRPHRALAAFYWYATRRKVRARNILHLAASQSMRAYARWMTSVERLDEVKKTATQMVRGWASRPGFSVLLNLDPETPPSALTATIASVQQQYYGQWELILVGSNSAVLSKLPDDPRIRLGAASARNAAEALSLGITEAHGDYVLPLEPGSRLSPAALLRLGEALQDSSSPAVLYGDEDRLNWRGRRTRPWFKPAWNEELFLAQDYISAGCAVRTDLAREALPVADDLSLVATYVLLLSIVATGNAEIRHIPHILCHRSTARDDSTRQIEYVAAVAGHLNGSGANALPGPYGSVRVTWPLPPDLPLVSIIIPTRDKVKLLQACVDGLLAVTHYPRMEILIIDNGSIEPATHLYMQSLTEDPRVRVLPYSAPYNYSAINNFAAAQSQGEYLCLLNNDTEILEGEWLTQMMRQAMRPHVGAVGAKLLYEDGSIQHAGIIVGLDGAAGHAHQFLRKGQTGYFNLPHLPHYVSAVTAACLVVERRKFEAVGGLDADQLAVAFNDVDLCLKLQQAGFQNIYEPCAVLIHHEAKSRGRNVSSQHIERYRLELSVLQERWGTMIVTDPVLNPNLDRRYGFLIGMGNNSGGSAKLK